MSRCYMRARARPYLVCVLLLLRSCFFSWVQTLLVIPELDFESARRSIDLTLSRPRCSVCEMGADTAMSCADERLVDSCLVNLR